MAQPESRLQRRIQEEIRRCGGFVFKVHGSEYMTAGLPDLIVCYRGHFIGMEVKMPDGKVSPRQDYIIEQIHSAGGIAEVVLSVRDALNILSAVDRAIESAQH